MSSLRISGGASRSARQVTFDKAGISIQRVKEYYMQSIDDLGQLAKHMTRSWYLASRESISLKWRRKETIVEESRETKRRPYRYPRHQTATHHDDRKKRNKIDEQGNS